MAHIQVHSVLFCQASLMHQAEDLTKNRVLRASSIAFIQLYSGAVTSMLRFFYRPIDFIKRSLCGYSDSPISSPSFLSSFCSLIGGASDPQSRPWIGALSSLIMDPESPSSVNGRESSRSTIRQYTIFQA